MRQRRITELLVAILALPCSTLAWVSSPNYPRWKLSIPKASAKLNVFTVESGTAANRPLHTNSTNAKRPPSKILSQSSFLGDIYRIRMPGIDEDGEDETSDGSFVAAMQVPTFAALPRISHKSSTLHSRTATTRSRGLEGALQHGPAFVLDHVLSPAECRDIIQTCESLGFGSFQAGKNHHGAMQIVVDNSTAQALAQKIGRHVDLQQVNERLEEMEQHTFQHHDEKIEDVRLVFAGLNRRWRIYRYNSGGVEHFAPHIDAGFPPSGVTPDGKELLWDISDGKMVSRLTVLFYLNDDFVGGETKFYQPLSQIAAGNLVKKVKTTDGSMGSMKEPPVIASVRPVAGSCLVFPQGVGEDAVDYARQNWPLHEGSPVISGQPKYVIRSDILFYVQRESLPVSDRLSQHDHVVRQTFLPKSFALEHHFLRHLDALYNPHMGVENLGPFLYSFLRMTKRRKVVEIGAGYTSLWILQALKDNDDELRAIRELQRVGQCRLLDWPWTVPDCVENFDSEAASLNCIDTCLHQKETATGASAIAQSLGLGPYMNFLQADAFTVELEPDSVDVLWCDFGVGSRMRDFVSQTWSSIRAGGFLLCHSTLTNQHTRDWLEAARSRQAEDITGMPPDEYVEISLLEPHKHYQNSISIFQKRKGYSEPVYSEYA